MYRLKKHILFSLIFLGSLKGFSLPPNVISVVKTDPLCLGVDDGTIVISATGTGTIQYSIDNGTTFQSSNTFTNLAPGTYDVVVEDGTGTSVQQIILVYEKTVIAAFIPSILTGAAVLNVDFTNTSVGATAFNWNLDGGTMNSTLVNPSFSYDMPGIYPVTLIASDNNCFDTASVSITVTGSSQILDIPNVFTPNGDGVNDVFYIPNIGISEMEVFIFNRYGEVVYEWYGRNGQWDGHTYPSGQAVPAGTYFYQVKATGFDSVEYNIQGLLTLLKNKTD